MPPSSHVSRTYRFFYYQLTGRLGPSGLLFILIKILGVGLSAYLSSKTTTPLLRPATATTPMATNLPEIASLVQEINASAQRLLQRPAGDYDDKNGKEKGEEVLSRATNDREEEERVRRNLVQAAEKLVIASRRPDENLYGTGTNV